MIHRESDRRGAAGETRRGSIRKDESAVRFAHSPFFFLEHHHAE